MPALLQCRVDIWMELCMAEHLQWLNLAFVSMPGSTEWLVLLLIGLLVFGRRLPEVARNLGRTVNEFKKGLRDFQESADEVVHDVNKVKNDVASEVKNASGLTDHGSYETGETTSDDEAPEASGEQQSPAET